MNARALEELDIVVMQGGPGVEREVSFESGAAVLKGLSDAGLKARSMDVSGEAGEIAALECDLVFIALHGEFGEDGTVQKLLDQRGIPYTGSNAKACALSMDKDASKRAFVQKNLPTAEWFCVSTGGKPMEVWGKSGFELPVVIKPVARGSSVGVTIVRRSEDLPAAFEAAFAVDDKVMVEAFIPGRELTVGLLGGEPLPIIELATDRGFYDYEAKYSDSGTKYLCPAPIIKEEEQQMRRLAVVAAESVGVQHMCRVDFRLDNGELKILEINAIPGFTSHSLLPMAAAEAGVDFPSLCRKVAELAWERKKIENK